MADILEFPALLRLIDDRSVAFRAAAASSGLDRPVPTCPKWTLADLVGHLGEVHRFWAATVAAGPADAPPQGLAPVEAPSAREELLDWSAESTRILLDALRAAGPDRGCWTWWAGSESPLNAGAVARHQVQEAAVHTYDAQATAGAPQPLPEQVALDGVDEFLTTCCAGTAPWPHEPATVEYHATEGGSWRLELSAAGASTTRLTAPGKADAAAHGSASELILSLYGRIPVRSLRIDGDERVFDQLMAWDPEA